MIKLEDLKIGDNIYGVCPDGLGLYAMSTVRNELFMLDVYPKACEAVICVGGHEIILRGEESYLFRTEKEADASLANLQLKLAEDLLKSDKFMDRLFECATSAKRLNKYAECPIYELAVALYKKRK